MNVKLFIVISSIVLFQVGCGIQNTEELPDTVAFQDEFTREFLKSSGEVEEGFYGFESATKGYTMFFPKNAKIEGESYERNKDGFESVSFLENGDTNLTTFYKVIYEERDRTNNIELQKELLSSQVSFDGEYTKFLRNNKKYYYGETVYEFTENKSFVYFVYVKGSNNDKGASFIAVVSCRDKEKQCEANSKEVKDHIEKVMYSIEL